MFTLDDPACIPASVSRVLDGQRRVVASARYFSDLVGSPEVRAAAVKLDALVEAGHVRGFHCTKELHPGVFRSRGLRTLSISQHLDEFLSFVKTAAPHLADEFERVYHVWRVDRQMSGREGLVSFCMSHQLVIEDGTERFFRYYGGEALYWPFPAGHRCLAFLESLGRPVVVEVALPARELSTFSNLPFARTLLGHYARQINPEFQVEQIEAPMRRSVVPSEILAVHERDSFFSMPWPEV